MAWIKSTRIFGGCAAALLAVCILGFAFTLLAAEAPPEEYAKAMKDIGTATQNLQKALAAEDFDGVTKNAVVMIDAFPKVEKYWMGKDPNAVKWAQTGGRAVTEIRVAAGLRSVEGIEYSAKQLTDSCQQCHATHREAQADGSFQIK
jgi:hypothetical protein